MQDRFFFFASCASDVQEKEAEKESTPQVEEGAEELFAGDPAKAFSIRPFQLSTCDSFRCVFRILCAVLAIKNAFVDCP